MSEPEAEKRVTWAELFFDLVFVLAVTEVSALLHDDHSWGGVVRALVVFVPIYWTWVGTSVHANAHDVDTPVERLAIFAIGLCGLFMALAVTGAYDERGLLFGGAYLALRGILAALVFRGPRIMLNPFSVGLFVSGPLLLLGGALDGTARVLVWAAAGLVDLSTPALLRRRLMVLRFNPAHLPERFGLFLIIALGESIVAVGSPAAQSTDLTAGMMAAVAGSFALACGLWWVYFAFAASAMRHALATTKMQTDVVRQVLSYGHLSFIGAVIAVAVGLAEVVVHPGEHLSWSVAGLLVGGCALYLATFGYTRWHMFRLVSTTRLTAAAAVLVLLPLSVRVPGLVALFLLVAVVVTLNVVEYLRVRRAERAELEPAADPA